ncbi:MAG: urease accessory protein UreJ [Leptolyngbya sp. DLM2.Bin27]|nr:MAG: urease accessory protein UreJ [Leptolyngbya sp. DLM2.Bin27]
MNYCFAALNAIGPRVPQTALGRRVLLAVSALLLLPLPSLAHHPLEGRVPATFAEGFLSGLAHPVIGLDHLAVVVAVGLLAAVSAGGAAIPVAFGVAAMVGTGLHLAAITLPAAELVIAASVLGFGVLLALKDRPQSAVMIGLAALAGLFHGFAYGEAIFGAQTLPLVAYLTGFTAVQLGIAIAAFLAGRQLVQRSTARLVQRAGLVICGVGATFLATELLDTLLA